MDNGNKMGNVNKQLLRNQKKKTKQNKTKQNKNKKQNKTKQKRKGKRENLTATTRTRSLSFLLPLLRACTTRADAATTRDTGDAAARSTRGN